MDDLISRSALFEKIQPVDFLYGDDEAPAYSGMAVSAGDIESAPAVEAVEVVRCKDCRRFKPHEERPEFGFCKLYPLGLAKHENGFCEHGERKENETD